MKTISLIMESHMGWSALLASALILATTAENSRGAVIVHFVEEETDVRISFSGTLRLGALTEIGVLGDASHALSSNFIVAGGSGFSGLGGAAEPLPFSRYTVAPIPPSEVFGFSFGFVMWSPRHVTGGTVGGTVTELTADPLLDSFVLPDTSLIALNADVGSIAEGTTLWTSTAPASDTFIFSRLAPVPEPSTTLFGWLATVGLFYRRCRH